MSTTPIPSVCKEFDEAASAAFIFLPRDFGYNERAAELHGYECSKRFVSPMLEVTVYREVGEPPWVALTVVLAREPRKTESYDLAVLAEVRCPGCGYLDQRGSLEEMLSFQASVLRKYGADLLAGDFELLPKLRSHSPQSESGYS